jgi:hypothetical protein
VRLPQLTKTQKKIAIGAALALGLVGVAYAARKKAPPALPSGVSTAQDTEIRKVVDRVLTEKPPWPADPETDYVTLATLAKRLLDAGYKTLGDRVANRARKFQPSDPTQWLL